LAQAFSAIGVQPMFSRKTATSGVGDVGGAAQRPSGGAAQKPSSGVGHGGVEQRPGEACKKGHPMTAVQISAQEDRMCDVCEADIKAGDRRFRCDQGCDWDVCLRCGDSSKQVIQPTAPRVGLIVDAIEFKVMSGVDSVDYSTKPLVKIRDFNTKDVITKTHAFNTSPQLSYSMKIPPEENVYFNLYDEQGSSSGVLIEACVPHRLRADKVIGQEKLLADDVLQAMSSTGLDGRCEVTLKLLTAHFARPGEVAAEITLHLREDERRSGAGAWAGVRVKRWLQLRAAPKPRSFLDCRRILSTLAQFPGPGLHVEVLDVACDLALQDVSSIMSEHQDGSAHSSKEKTPAARARILAEEINALEVEAQREAGLYGSVQDQLMKLRQGTSNSLCDAAIKKGDIPLMKAALVGAWALTQDVSAGLPYELEKEYRYKCRFPDRTTLEDLLNSGSVDDELRQPTDGGLQLAQDHITPISVDDHLRFSVRDDTAERVLMLLGWVGAGKHKARLDYEQCSAKLLSDPCFRLPHCVMELLKRVVLFDGEPAYEVSKMTYPEIVLSRQKQAEGQALLGMFDLVAMPMRAEYGPDFTPLGHNQKSEKDLWEWGSAGEDAVGGAGWFWIMHGAAPNIGENEMAEDFNEYSMPLEERPEVTAFLSVISVVPWGVLGMQLTSRGDKRNAEAPDGRTAFVDPAGLPYIQSMGPGGAGGASGAIYRYLGIDRERAFAPEVRNGIRQATDAKFHAYGDNKVIHAVGPDLRDSQYRVRGDAVEGSPQHAMALGDLSKAYRNIFTEFLASGLPKLRLLPVSGAIFSGDFGSHEGVFPAMTVEGIGSGFRQLREAEQNELKTKEIELCIFSDGELEDYAFALTGDASSAANVGQETAAGASGGCLGGRGSSPPKVPRKKRQGRRILDEDRYVRDLGAMWRGSLRASLHLKAQHIVLFPFGMGAFLRNLHKKDPVYSEEYRMRQLRYRCCELLYTSIVEVVVEQKSRMQVHICLLDAGGESRTNHNVFVEAACAQAKATPALANSLQFHRNVDALELASKLATSDTQDQSADVRPVVLLNGANKKLLGNHWFSHGARNAIDENLHRRSAPLAMGSLILNGGTKPYSRCRGELAETTRFFGGQVVKFPPYDDPAKR